MKKIVPYLPRGRDIGACAFSERALSGRDARARSGIYAIGCDCHG